MLTVTGYALPGQDTEVLAWGQPTSIDTDLRRDDPPVSTHPAGQLRLRYASLGRGRATRKDASKPGAAGSRGRGRSTA